MSGILDLSEIVLVSGESVSMVSEAASSGKRILVFDLKRTKKISRHDYAMKRLAELDYIIRTPADKIHEIILNVSGMKGPARRLDNKEKMYEKLYRII